MSTRSFTASLAVAALALTSACGDTPASPPYEPVLPTEWVIGVTNPFFPLVPGTTLNYSAQTSDGLERITVEVLTNTRTVNGVTAVVVRDRVYLDGTLIEDTYDWYAQDVEGNVWYLGEDSKVIENGVVVSTEGSWEWGVDGALPGVIMWADPAAKVGIAYRQEYYAGVAEDWGQVISLGQTVVVPYGRLTDCLQTKDWNGLESGGAEYKYYCPQLGLALETTPSGSGRVELIERLSP
jgi:hypothetical protein